jgi:hypothetical protein
MLSLFPSPGRRSFLIAAAGVALITVACSSTESSLLGPGPGANAGAPSPSSTSGGTSGTSNGGTEPSSSGNQASSSGVSSSNGSSGVSSSASSSSGMASSGMASSGMASSGMASSGMASSGMASSTSSSSGMMPDPDDKRVACSEKEGMESYCAPGEVCCANSRQGGGGVIATGGTCTLRTAQCKRTTPTVFRLECDDNQDCGTGQSCCLDTSNPSSYVAQCESRACRTQQDELQLCDLQSPTCPNGFVCKDSGSLGPLGVNYGLCRRP